MFLHAAVALWGDQRRASGVRTCSLQTATERAGLSARRRFLRPRPHHLLFHASRTGFSSLLLSWLRRCVPSEAVTLCKGSVCDCIGKRCSTCRLTVPNRTSVRSGERCLQFLAAHAERKAGAGSTGNWHRGLSARIGRCRVLPRGEEGGRQRRVERRSACAGASWTERLRLEAVPAPSHSCVPQTPPRSTASYACASASFPVTGASAWRSVAAGSVGRRFDAQVAARGGAADSWRSRLGASRRRAAPPGAPVISSSTFCRSSLFARRSPAERSSQRFGPPLVERLRCRLWAERLSALGASAGCQRCSRRPRRRVSPRACRLPPASFTLRPPP